MWVAIFVAWALVILLAYRLGVRQANAARDLDARFDRVDKMIADVYKRIDDETRELRDTTSSDIANLWRNMSDMQAEMMNNPQSKTKR